MATGPVEFEYLKGRNVGKVVMTWTSDASSGAAAGTTDEPIYGEVLRITTIPDGTAAPSADYDIVLNDEDSVDVALGTLADRHTSNTESVYPTVAGSAGNNTDVRGVVAGRISVAVTNAGNSKKGKIVLYIRR